MKSQLTAVLVILAYALPAQGKEGLPPKKRPGGMEEVETVTSGDSEIEILPDGSRIIRTTSDSGEMIEKHIPPDDPSMAGLGHMPPEQLRRHGGGFFDATVMVRPPRLAPGETGDLYVHVTLRGPAVVLPGARIEARYKRAQGPLALGSQEPKPARLGARKTRFKGKPVWDDSLTFKIPVTVRSDAKHGETPFEGTVMLEITHGDTGDMIGRFQAVAPGRIEIGRPFPRPVPQVGGRAAAGSSPIKGRGVKPAGAGTKAGAAATNRPRGDDGSGVKAAGEGHLAGTDPTGSGPVSTAPGEEIAGEGGADMVDMDWAFWGIGGLLVLLLLLVLRRR
ncbi:MAG: hypothetical protein V3U11_00560 [Planctomycetota bacterium]